MMHNATKQNRRFMAEIHSEFTLSKWKSLLELYSRTKKLNRIKKVCIYPRANILIILIKKDRLGKTRLNVYEDQASIYRLKINQLELFSNNHRVFQSDSQHQNMASLLSKLNMSEPIRAICQIKSKIILWLNNV